MLKNIMARKHVMMLLTIAFLTGACGLNREKTGSPGMTAQTQATEETQTAAQTPPAGQTQAAAQTSPAGQTQTAAQTPPAEQTPPTEQAQAASQTTTRSDDGNNVSGSEEPSGFVMLGDVVPDAILEIRYYSTYNFVGDRIDGYEEPLAILTKEAADALKEVSDELLPQGYRLKIYDAYRPQMAVTHFKNWAMNTDDTRMKEYFYPELKKTDLFSLGYIAERSGHSRGSTVDLTLFDMAKGKEADMGGTFDYFGRLSRADYGGITTEQYNNRRLLREAMMKHGFQPFDGEWWHFTLKNEPYPDTYFTFPVNRDALNP